MQCGDEDTLDYEAVSRLSPEGRRQPAILLLVVDEVSAFWLLWLGSFGGKPPHVR